MQTVFNEQLHKRHRKDGPQSLFCLLQENLQLKSINNGIVLHKNIQVLPSALHSFCEEISLRNKIIIGLVIDKRSKQKFLCFTVAADAHYKSTTGQFDAVTVVVEITQAVTSTQGD